MHCWGCAIGAEWPSDDCLPIDNAENSAAARARKLDNSSDAEDLGDFQRAIGLQFMLESLGSCS